MICREIFGPGIYVDDTLTRTTYLNIDADQVHPFMTIVFTDPKLIKHLWDMLEKQEKNKEKQFKELKGHAADVLGPDTTGHLQRSCGVHAMTGQSCFGRRPTHLNTLNIFTIKLL